MSALERIVYRSTATGRTDSVLNMATILGESQHNNTRDELTGVLAAHEGCYIQVLEGVGPALDNLLRRLADDPRHRDLVVLDRTPITDRRFGEWAMANARISTGRAAALKQLITGPEPSAAELIDLLDAAVERR